MTRDGDEAAPCLPASGAAPAFRCAFCGEERDANDLFAGTRGAYICVACVELLHEQLEDRRAETSVPPSMRGRPTGRRRLSSP